MSITKKMVVIATSCIDESESIAIAIQNLQLDTKPTYPQRGLEGLLEALKTAFNDAKLIILSTDVFEDENINIISVVRALKKNFPELMIIVYRNINDDNSCTSKEIKEAGANIVTKVEVGYEENICGTIRKQLNLTTEEPSSYDKNPNQNPTKMVKTPVLKKNDMRNRIIDIETENTGEEPKSKTRNQNTIAEDRSKPSETGICFKELLPVNSLSKEILLFLIEKTIGDLQFLKTQLLSDKSGVDDSSLDKKESIDNSVTDNFIGTERENTISRFERIQISKSKFRIKINGFTVILTKCQLEVLEIIAKENGRKISAIDIGEKLNGVSQASVTQRLISLRRVLRETHPKLNGCVVSSKKGYGFNLNV